MLEVSDYIFGLQVVPKEVFRQADGGSFPARRPAKAEARAQQMPAAFSEHGKETTCEGVQRYIVGDVVANR